MLAVDVVMQANAPARTASVMPAVATQRSPLRQRRAAAVVRRVRRPQQRPLPLAVSVADVNQDAIAVAMVHVLAKIASAPAPHVLSKRQ